MRNVQPAGRGKSVPSGVEGAWFVRRKRGRHCGLRAASREGRLLTILYTLWVSGIAAFLASSDLRAAWVAGGIVLVVAATILFIVTAIRMSAPEPSQGRSGCS